MSLDHTLARLAHELDVDKAARVGRAYELVFVGDPRRVWLDLRAGVVVTTVAVSDACRLGVVPEDLEALLDGRAALRTLFATGRLRVFGKLEDAMRLEALFL